MVFVRLLLRLRYGPVPKMYNVDLEYEGNAYFDWMTIRSGPILA